MALKLREEDRKKLSAYVDSSIFPRSELSNIINAEGADELIVALTKLYNLSSDQKKDIWFHVVYNVWKPHDRDTCFTEVESIFFRQLIENRGYLKKKDCLKIGVLGTEFLARKCQKSMEEMGLIQVYRLGNSELVYILNIEFYEEVFGNGKKA